MSDLEKLGGLEAADKWLKEPVSKEDEVGKQLEEGAAFVEALIERVKELEWHYKRKPDCCCDRCFNLAFVKDVSEEYEAKLQSARELAETVRDLEHKSHHAFAAWPRPFEQCPHAVCVKAREFLEKIK